MGIVIDGCIRDFLQVVGDLDIGLWIKGTTPNFHTQTNIFPSPSMSPLPVAANSSCLGISLSPMTTVPCSFQPS